MNSHVRECLRCKVTWGVSHSKGWVDTWEIHHLLLGVQWGKVTERCWAWPSWLQDSCVTVSVFQGRGGAREAIKASVRRPGTHYHVPSTLPSQTPFSIGQLSSVCMAGSSIQIADWFSQCPCRASHEPPEWVPVRYSVFLGLKMINGDDTWGVVLLSVDMVWIVFFSYHNICLYVYVCVCICFIFVTHN